MIRGSFLWLLAAVVVVLGCSPDKGRVSYRDGGPVTDGAPLPGAPDADGDGISDTWEGRDDPGGPVDTDGDGTPDYLDADSDGDGIPDIVEGNTRRSGDEPADTDGDGIYDFRDDDSDGNGIPDSTEGAVDTDGDGDPDFRDTDNDGDRILDVEEIGGSPASPVDFDGDGTPDYMDPDSDGDFIGDLHESTLDTDGDGLPDRHDADTDADGFSDADEAGDTDVETPPDDTDSDTIPDFRDPDSDNDGLSDADELAHGTSRTSADTDGDGVSDLVEVAACPAGDTTCAGDATDGTSSPRTRGDFVFLEPYMAPPDPLRDTLDFATDIRVADTYFLIDTTGSMSGAIANVRSSLSTPGTGIIDQVRTTIVDTWFGVGEFRDYGDAFIYRNQSDLTVDAATAQAAVNRLSASGGGDGPEADVPSLWAVATGGAIPRGTARTDCPMGTFGWPCFRDGAVPIVVLITDAPFHNGPTGGYPYTGYTDYATMRAAVVAARIRVIGIAVGSGPLADLQAIARDSGAVDAAGAPLVSLASSGSVSGEVVNQIRILASQTRLDISVVYEDDPTDAVDTWAAFVDHVEANTAGDAVRGCEPRAADDTDGDGFPDTFRAVSGSRVCFDIVVKQNDTVAPTASPQLFQATLRVLGDGFTELDSRDVFFLVPPVVEIPGGPD